MTTLNYSGPNGFTATIEENQDGTFTLSTSPVPDHASPQSCGSLHIAEEEVFTRMRRVARG